LEQALELLADRVERMPEGCAVDTKYPDVYYVPEDAAFGVQDGSVRFRHAGGDHTLTLRPGGRFDSRAFGALGQLALQLGGAH
jgi:hypothetical protein